MSYDNNDVEYESGAPKKADVLIKSTQTIVAKQEELAEQTKLAISRIDEAIELCHKNSEEASYILEHSTEMFDKLQAENSALKQELLYLAKQSENIYAGLAEKLSEMEQENRQQNGEAELDENYYELADRLAEIYDQIAEISARVDALAVQKTEDSLNDKFAILYDKIDAVAVDAARPVGGGLSASESRAILDKLDQLADSMRKNESAHSMLADRFEILSMRVEQFGYGSAKAQPAYAQPVASYPAPVQPAQTAEIDYDKLAAKVADLLSVRDAVSPDYIASKVAEQIVLPEQTGAEIDTQELAKEVAALIDVKGAVLEAEAERAPLELDEEAIVTKISDRVGELVAEAKIEPVDEDALADKLAERLGTAAVDVNEETLAERIAEKLNITDSVVAPVDIDEEALAERLAEKLNVVSEHEDEEAEVTEDTPVFDEDALVDKIVERLSGTLNTETNIDQEDLADAIALKVGSIKPEDFEILVDDAGCASISKEIAEKLDYEFISSLVADKLREILDINAANAPDYEDMAERISEKITVAGINEDAIADKAAAVLSNYLPEFDVEEIADKVTGAVIDVVAAMPQPTVDSEAICNEITERLIEKQEDNNYDIVIDDDGISRITAIVTEEIEKDTDARFDKLEESLAKINELVSNIVVEAEEEPEEVEEEVTEEEYQTISDLVNTLSTHIETVEGKIDTLTELIGEPEEVEEEYTEGEEEYSEELDEDEYAKLSEIVAARFDSVEGKIDSLTELITGTEEVEEYEEVTEEDFKALSEIVATEIEKGVASRFDSVEEDIRKLHSLVGGLAVADATGETVADVHFYEQLDKLSEDIKKIAEYVEGDVPVVSNERLDKIAEDVAKISQLVDGELSVETAARLDKLQEEIEEILRLLGTAGDGDGLKGIIIGGVAAPADETAASVAEAEEEELIKVSDLVKPIPVAGDEEEDDDDGDFLLSALDMDSFSEDERMPGEIGDFEGVDFENMMKYNRSFIARIIQSEDDTKQYYGAVKHALLSYRKVNSNVAWGNERFNKGRETIARMKIRGKTLVIYLALDPNEYKTSVYHHADVSDNKSVLGTPMMIKVKSPLGVRKAIRLIDEMLAKRNGEKRDVPERDYAAMYPYETIEELIEDGLVKDVRKK